MIKGKKTIKVKGCYHGFKQGGGKYKEFLFSIPPPGEAEEEKKYLEMLNEQEDQEHEHRNRDGKPRFQVSLLRLYVSLEKRVSWPRVLWDYSY